MVVSLFRRVHDEGLLHGIGFDPNALGGLLTDLVDAGIPEEKLFRCLTLRLPHEDEIDLRKIYEVEQYYPEVYAYFMGVYERGWELTEELLRRGMDEGVFRRENVELVRSLLESGLKMLYQGDFLQRTGLAYHDALVQTVDIILRGIRAKE